MMLNYALVFLSALYTVTAIDDNCLKCICKVESNCKTNIGCKDDMGSPSCGPYQIKEAYWKDCGRPEGDYRKCANDKGCAEKCVKAYMAKYAAKCRANPNCEVFSRVHNGGPKGCQRKATAGYWSKVKNCLG